MPHSSDVTTSVDATHGPDNVHVPAWFKFVRKAFRFRISDTCYPSSPVLSVLDAQYSDIDVKHVLYGGTGSEPILLGHKVAPGAKITNCWPSTWQRPRDQLDGQPVDLVLTCKFLEKWPAIISTVARAMGVSGEVNRGKFDAFAKLALENDVLPPNDHGVVFPIGKTMFVCFKCVDGFNHLAIINDGFVLEVVELPTVIAVEPPVNGITIEELS